jgi:putative flippase GtrA
MSLLDSKERERFLKFALVGTIGAGIDFGIMNLLTQAFHLALVISGTISFVCAVISNFLWNRYWTYPESRTRRVSHQLFMFFVVNLAGVLIRIPILKYIEPPLLDYIVNLNPNVSVTSEFLAKNLTLSLAIGIVMLWNFFVNRYWTYNDIDNIT